MLLVEDTETLAMIIKETLDDEGFDVTVAGDGLQGLAALDVMTPDVLVVDIMMPQMDGFEMVSKLRRADRRTPVLFLTARSTVEDVVKGFNLGGNDYLRKPFSIQELIVRLRSLVNRMDSAKDPGVLKVGAFTLNTGAQTLAIDDEVTELSHREAELLKMLVENANNIVPISDILSQLWGSDTYYNNRSLQVFITKLRRILSKDSTIQILNARGVGYKLII